MTASCRDCGVALREGAAFCSACGAAVAVVPPPQPPPGLTPDPPPAASSSASSSSAGDGDVAVGDAGHGGRATAAAWASRVLGGGWGTPALVAGAALGALVLGSLVTVLGMLGERASVGVVWQTTAALTGAAFGGDLRAATSWSDGDGLLDRIVGGREWGYRLSAVPLGLTLPTLAVLGIGFWLRTRRTPPTDLVPVAVRTSIALALGVFCVTLLGRAGTGTVAGGDGVGLGDFEPGLRVDLHATAPGSTLGALVAAAIVLGLVLATTRRSLLPGRAAGALDALAAPAWVLALAAGALLVVAGVALLVAVAVIGRAPSGEQVATAVVGLPVIAAWLLAVGSGPGVEVGRGRLVGSGAFEGGDLGDLGDRTGATGTVHLSGLAHVTPLAWFLPVVLLGCLVLAGLLLATRYDSAAAARRGGLVAGALTCVVTTLWCSLSRVEVTASPSGTSIRPHALGVGLWVGVLVAASCLLATVLLPRLPAPVLRGLAVVARRPAEPQPAAT